jgi:hypothetical protein
MARMGHDSERAAMVYQHAARGADAAITNAIDAHIDAEQDADEDEQWPERGAGPSGLMARRGGRRLQASVRHRRSRALTWDYKLERAKGIEPS